MTRRMISAVMMVVCTGFFLTGCAPKMSMDEMKPQRPAELDKLNAFVGKWSFEGEMQMAGADETMKTSGEHDTKWGPGKWYLVSDDQYEMGELGSMTGMGTWTYDASSRKYRTSWVDTMGSIGVGTMSHDDRTNTWKMRGTSYGSMGKTCFRGHIHFVDPNTTEWVYKEYAMGGLMKVFEISGTSRRK